MWNARGFLRSLLAFSLSIVAAQWAAAQQNYWLTRTTQAARSVSNAGATSPPSPRVVDWEDTGIMSDLIVASTATATVTGGYVPPGRVTGHGEAHGQSEHDPDDQALLGWSFIHNPVLGTLDGIGPGQPTGGAAQWTGVEAAAVLNSTSGVGTTTAHFCIDGFGWVSVRTVPFGPFTRNITVNVTFGTAYLQVSGAGANPVTAAGVDGWGNTFLKQSTTGINSDIGSFGIGPGEFTGPLSVGGTASIIAPTGIPGQTMPSIMSAIGGGSVVGWGQIVHCYGSGLFQGSFRIQVDSPAP